MFVLVTETCAEYWVSGFQGCTEKRQAMTIIFVSNYINHHQIPFCDAMRRLCGEAGGNFFFIQTQPMEEERIRMGWQDKERPEYVRCFYEEETACRQLIRDSEVVLFGGCDDESYIEERLQSGGLIIRISERLYKTGQWKAVSPRGLLKKYHDHTRYRKAPVYLLCAGGYVASDFHIIHAYTGKMFCWGYFPETKHYDVDQLMAGKGYLPPEADSSKTARIPYILWAARFLDWKHPELALEAASYLRDKGLEFHMDIIGGGDMEEEIRRQLMELKLEDRVSLLGYRTPAQVREYMEKADIYLFTSDRQEGWGAVANEAMNSGCALVADHMIGAVPYLINQGENGYLYRDGCKEMLFQMAETLVKDVSLRERMGRQAYKTITEVWNGEKAAAGLMELIEKIRDGRETKPAPGCTEQNQNTGPYPCMPEKAVGERKMFGRLNGNIFQKKRR